jgi:hypothetical protein
MSTFDHQVAAGREWFGNPAETPTTRCFLCVGRWMPWNFGRGSGRRAKWNLATALLMWIRAHSVRAD